ncbi:Uncharacterised protein [Mycobacteroides abscessus subsp. abscessus]|nr:Uncharacterised protein [Mycobacteroides abscessus subsp. abscessus]SIL77800.1 Uncharacterised protein [Mycobacteroides abscessus subsp. abscessus]
MHVVFRQPLGPHGHQPGVIGPCTHIAEVDLVATDKQLDTVNAVPTKRIDGTGGDRSR